MGPVHRTKCSHSGELWEGKNIHVFGGGSEWASRFMPTQTCVSYLMAVVSLLPSHSHTISPVVHTNGKHAAKGILGNAVQPHQVDTHQATIPGQLIPGCVAFPWQHIALPKWLCPLLVQYLHPRKPFFLGQPCLSIDATGLEQVKAWWRRTRRWASSWGNPTTIQLQLERKRVWSLGWAQ